jgi:hypothetical protein
LRVGLPLLLGDRPHAVAERSAAALFRARFERATGERRQRGPPPPPHFKQQRIFKMTPAQYQELMTTVEHMRNTSDALSRTCQMLAASETSAARHGYFHRLHIALNDCATSLRHAIDAAPTMVQK